MEKLPARNFISMLTNGFKNGFIWVSRFHHKMKPWLHRFHVTVSFMQPLKALILKAFTKVVSMLCNRCETISLAVSSVPPVYYTGGMKPMARWGTKKCARESK